MFIDFCILFIDCLVRVMFVFIFRYILVYFNYFIWIVLIIMVKDINKFFLYRGDFWFYKVSCGGIIKGKFFCLFLC